MTGTTAGTPERPRRFYELTGVLLGLLGCLGCATALTVASLASGDTRVASGLVQLAGRAVVAVALVGIWRRRPAGRLRPAGRPWYARTGVLVALALTSSAALGGVAVVVSDGGAVPWIEVVAGVVAVGTVLTLAGYGLRWRREESVRTSR